MHELAVCQALMRQVDEIATREAAERVTRIILQIGPLSGVVPELLQQAFTIARTGTVAETAELVTQTQPVRVRCTICGAESDATPNRLLCGACGDYRTQLIGGDELLLASLELERADSK
ncbi:hydrogenase maturation nickel metallochaperone HypA [Candidatus Endoriftia persephone]|jgi:hydrogenase nickel incorporation protein HypA/HybF|uniref:Hydrogenase maturation factor HypA n=3 Tax=Gammaproteobacteria TaxID=1236 RepID=G2FIG1_9GAMM|nr:hydrogenase maturation nickel metallochaperone HypA [Candidatus Endoriftia persephone]EGV51833.1 hydrogenase expression/synthesis protein [endosymbiont of Riftia pachyptila (vent Ph05)]EGW53432.1 hydrogenase expression/synthesis HypA [endosymbiont of Tevnia jerichonana (vent Tica)]USF89048.1 hydrogenase maturation nickel metallochaperone HypA [Candidatus Endoriftia persephone]